MVQSLPDKEIPPIGHEQGNGSTLVKSKRILHRRHQLLVTKQLVLFNNSPEASRRCKFLLRIRQEEETVEYNMTLKCRHADRYLAASYDLSSANKNAQMKFDEDIRTPFISNSSLSVSFEEHKIGTNDYNYG
jgi:hypothetical protein